MSGELQLQPLLLGRWGLAPGLLLLSGVLKLLLTGLCLETGWRGGLIFPVLTGSAAIGMGLHQLLPALGQAGIWLGSVAGGCLGALLPSPLLALVLGLVLLNGHGAEALLIGLSAQPDAEAPERGASRLSWAQARASTGVATLGS